MALKAAPNPADSAPVELARHKPQLLIVTQNMDGLSERAGQANSNLVPIYGSVFAIRCADDDCSYAAQNYSNEPTVLGLAKPSQNISSVKQQLPQVSKGSIPTCPLCQSAILRPGVVWYGKKLPSKALKSIEDWWDTPPTVDLVLVIGTTRTSFVCDALNQGAAIASFDFFDSQDSAEHVIIYNDDEWLVNGDVLRTLSELIREVNLHL
ncbi:hypothetical protein LTR56_027550 [Elasticomyces elasticus]|nr:hypothetical protein LTR56_027550 [Elasticomyces elasticus]KAK3614994.1 hypothetical protein LTR22_027599 [Elasticomyces elasticus]KAK4896182.1 hypothetical protein LTR49_028170 [Elasticomyces elasticus]KAK5732761.1 hypothetical protein LTS12_027071 [Elasticomyces elasticus]